MPRVTIRRDRRIVSKKKALRLRKVMEQVVAEVLNVPPSEVEVLSRKFKKHDINHPPIGIDIDTGTGKNRWRLISKDRLGKALAAGILEHKAISKKLLRATGPYVWLRICGGTFVPIGFPQHTR